MDYDAIRRDVRDLLAQYGPLHLYEIATYLVDEQDESVADLVDDRGNVDLDRLNDIVWGVREAADSDFDWFPHQRDDGSLCDIEMVLAGLTLTHVLTEHEVADGHVDLDPDLTPLILLFEDDIPLSAPGTWARIVAPERDHFIVESDAPDWLPGGVGDVLAVTIDGGEVDLQITDAAVLNADPSGDADRLAEVYEQLDGAPELPDLIAEVRIRYPRFLSAPSAPLGRLLDAAGLEVRDDLVYRIGDPDDLDDEGLTNHLRDAHGLDQQTIDDLFLLDRELSAIVTMGVRKQLEAFAEDQPETQQAAALQDLADGFEVVEPTMDPQAVLGLLAGLMEDDQATSALLEDFVGSSMPMAAVIAAAGRDLDRVVRDRIGRSNLRWVVGRCLEIQGDTAAAERWLRDAKAVDPGHGGATFDLVGFVDDRGQAGAALGMLQELGVTRAAPDWVASMRRYAEPGPASTGRNDPCGCGSGRKHKACCGPANGWPLIERIPWLWDKVIRFATRDPQQEELHELGHVLGSEYAEAGAVVLMGAALAEGGLLGTFGAVRGRLLPPDERAVIESWADVRASLYEVVDVDPGASVELLDLRGGDRHVVTERTASRDLAVGQTLLTWLHPYPDGTTRMGTGVVPVELRHRDMWLDVLDADEVDPEDILVGARRMWAPPAMQNTDGEPLVMCTRVWRVGDPDAVRGALDADLEEGGDDAWVINAETANSPMGTSVVATFRLEGDLLTIETNSVERLLRYSAEVEPRLGEAEVVDERRIPAADLMARARPGELDDDEWDEDWEDWGDDDLDDDLDYDDLDPEAQAELDEVMTGHMEQYEEKWCDLPVPALDGMTPRQAADDPTRRPDLEVLLDEMDAGPAWTGPGRGMSSARLRELLGLD